MSSFSFPFPTNGTDNQVTAEMAREFNAALFTNGILEDFVLASQTNSVLRFSSGQAIVDGAFFSVGSGVSIDLSARSEESLYIVVRMDVSNRSSTMLATTELSDLDNLRDLVVGKATLTSSGYTFSATNKAPYSTATHVDGSIINNGSIVGSKIKNLSITADKLEGKIPTSKLTQKVFGSHVTSGLIPIGGKVEITVPLPSGWAAVNSMVCTITNGKTEVVALADGINRSIYIYNNDNVVKNATVFYMLFGY